MQIPKADPEVTKLFEALTPKTPAVVPKKMFGQPAAFANGNLFMGVYGATLFVRLCEPDRMKASSKAGFVAFEPMPGRAMREYWVLPPSVVNDKAEARRWVARALSYALTLPAKKPKVRS